ncbi:hypothetical protein FUT69_08400 [Xylella taiwanensis]|uniref:hypothetical protein n=2 Tax=Xylella taiwanensis TaxID=1444770 RepID=UPI00126981FE|nr:hypothetical protein [Xylella taiwanensis]NBI37174.1 hypothetical protein [Xylella taiwanensis]QKD98400.1 hypothetical protein PLS229_05670 [Xylella taiwanensis]UFM93654.1 hypothetical protein LPH39_11400 [Xylella taiwanensis]UFN02234.1 hypothetical protein LPH43_11460 [Xylella taiwanensis]UFN06705.1 hypothetical protein LPH42_11265 [Xylella taiwanensis]
MLIFRDGKPCKGMSYDPSVITYRMFLRDRISSLTLVLDRLDEIVLKADCALDDLAGLEGARSVRLADEFLTTVFSAYVACRTLIEH